MHRVRMPPTRRSDLPSACAAIHQQRDSVRAVTAEPRTVGSRAGPVFAPAASGNRRRGSSAPCRKVASRDFRAGTPSSRRSTGRSCPSSLAGSGTATCDPQQGARFPHPRPPRGHNHGALQLRRLRPGQQHRSARVEQVRSRAQPAPMGRQRSGVRRQRVGCDRRESRDVHQTPWDGHVLDRLCPLLLPFGDLPRWPLVQDDGWLGRPNAGDWSWIQYRSAVRARPMRVPVRGWVGPSQRIVHRW